MAEATLQNRIIETTARIMGLPTNETKLDFYRGDVENVNALESEYESLSDDALRAKTLEFKARIDPTNPNRESLEDILPEAFAAVREASKRTIGLRHHDVQIMAGAVLADSSIAEMRTGEGKTLVATLPLYLKALEGKGAHLVTVNDYLARRDARLMAPIFQFLGMNVGVLQSGAVTENAKKAFIVDTSVDSAEEQTNHLRKVDRNEAYNADITYGTNSEFGFDYLRDNMAAFIEDKVQRGHHFVVIDEVDNILIDEARTPLIISGELPVNEEMYKKMSFIVKQLKPGDYEINDKDKTVNLTEAGSNLVQKLLGEKIADLGVPEANNPQIAIISGYLEQALRAQFLFHINKDYLVQGGKAVIIDEFTGRLMPTRRWADGLHQAIEAKENLKIMPESVTMASITLQNYFRMYKSRSGMTGTGITEAEEFSTVYGLDVIEIPTHQKDLRIDETDSVYKTKDAKLRAIVKELVFQNAIGRPVLLGTTSVEKSEQLSSYLDSEHINTILLTFLIRERWFHNQGELDDDKKVNELAALNLPMEDLLSDKFFINALAKKVGLNTDLTSTENLNFLTTFLGLTNKDIPRLKDILIKGINHKVLNARKDGSESGIIAGAGAFGGVTIATNMAGRGVDIKLGGELGEEVVSGVNLVLKRHGVGNPFELSLEEKLIALGKVDHRKYGRHKNEVASFIKYMRELPVVKGLGGLRVIGSERHEARRIDNQLRGRAARQGDPGSTKFYLSLQDDLVMRIDPNQNTSKMLSKFDVDSSKPIQGEMVSWAIENSQKRIEGVNFDVRKHLLEYDDVLNKQRTLIYSQRDKVLSKRTETSDLENIIKVDLSGDIDRILKEEISAKIAEGLKEKNLSPVTQFLELMQESYEIDGEIFPSFNDKFMLDTLNRMDGDLRSNLQILAARAHSANPNNMGGNFLAEAFKDLDIELANINTPIGDQEKLRLLRRVAVGARFARDEKTGRPGIAIYKRIDFSPLVANELIKRHEKEPVKILEAITTHFSEAKAFQVKAWGKEEMTNPNHSPLPGVPDTVEGRGLHRLNLGYKAILQKYITEQWTQYLTRMEALRTSVGTEAYAKRDPLITYKSQAADQMLELLGDIRTLTLLTTFWQVPKPVNWQKFAKPVITLPPLPTVKTTRS
jgi:preprotein translocase subunit SecA